MELTQQEIWDIFLNQIMEENNVSIKSIYECMKTNEDEINTMDTLFDSDEDLSIRKRLVLLYLISQDRAKENMEYYINNVEKSGDVSNSEIEKYKTLLIASLMFNIDFFIRACNWCGLIQLDVNKIKAKRIPSINRRTINNPFIYQQDLKLIFFKNEQNYNQSIGIRPDPDKVTTKYIKWIIPVPEPARPAAAGSKATTFNEISITYEGISGKLRFMQEPKKETYYEFVFDEYQYIIPFEIELHFTTICGKKKKHRINIPADKEHSKKKREENITKIFSDKYDNVDLSGGIKASYEVIIKPIDS